MANDSSMFSFQMDDMYPLHWPPNDMYGCSQNTLTQLQEKVLRSLSKKQEDENLQVVPENDCVFKDDSSSQGDFCREKSAVKESHIASCNHKEPKTEISQRNLNFPWSPRFRVSPLIDTITSAEPLRTPTFPFSPLTKSPGHFPTPASPLAVMLLSPFVGRKPSEDLSMYLPENFTPAATLERLERSVSTTVFEFPSVELRNQDECKVEEPKNEMDEGKIADAVKVNVGGEDDNLHVNADDVYVDLNDNNCFGEEYDFGEESNLAQGKGKRKRTGQKENKEDGNVVGFRNRLERKRRSEMNSKYDKLRRCIPEIENRQKVSKILVLKCAVQYIQELHRQDDLLTKQKNIEKLKNDELLKNLVKISS